MCSRSPAKEGSSNWRIQTTRHRSTDTSKNELWSTCQNLEVSKTWRHRPVSKATQRGLGHCPWIAMADSPSSYRLLQREGKELRRKRKHIFESSLLDQPPQSSDNTLETMWDTRMWNATGTSIDSERRAGPDNLTDHHCKENADPAGGGNTITRSGRIVRPPARLNL